jgi:hypothetical protein
LAKQYLSIIRLFEHCTIAYGDEINLPRIKKQLNAEFDHAASGFIEIDGYSYNKNDVFEELDRPDFLQRLAYHKALWENTAILVLLEDNALNIYDFRTQIEQFENDPRFDQFFSPYFEIPFNYISRSYLNEGRFENLGELLLYEDFLLPAQKEGGFKAVRLFLDENIRLLKNTSAVTLEQTRLQIDHWIFKPWRAFLNALPDEFHAQKVDLAVHLVNVTVLFQKENRHLSASITMELATLNGLPEHLQQTIRSNNKAFRNTGNSDNSGNYGWMIWAAIILIRFVSSC